MSSNFDAASFRVAQSGVSNVFRISPLLLVIGRTFVACIAAISVAIASSTPAPSTPATRCAYVIRCKRTS